MPGIPVPALPFGLRDVKLRAISNAGVKATGIDLPASRTFSFTDTEDFTDLTGDDSTLASHGGGPTVDWELESGGISIAAYQIIAGGATVNTGTTPATVSTYTKLTTDSRPYFEVEGQAISDSGGDMHAIVYRCKATGDLEGSFEGGGFYLTKAKGKGYGDTTGATPTNKLYVFVLNETAVSIVP